ncbi:MAG: hypothetical protein ACFE9Q_07515 [Candidatus Hodarchaeota archaeon]
MDLEISSGSLWYSTHYFELKIKITGAGTIDDPYLFTTKNRYPDESFEIRINNSNKYIEFIRINLKALYLKNNKNVKISNARIKVLGLGNSSKISIEKVNILKQLRLDKVQHIKIADCNIKKLYAFSGDQIYIYNSTIKTISRKSKANLIFQNEQRAQLLKSKSYQPDKHLELNIWICDQCGSAVDLFSRFCHECGYRLK